MPAIVCDSIDRLITVEMRPRGVPRGVIPRLYQQVRDLVGEPLTLRAARRLRDLPTGARVLLATGAGAANVLPQGETDGPLGTAALVRILNQGLRAHSIVLTTAGFERPIVAALGAYEAHADILSLSPDVEPDMATATAAAWLDSYDPHLAIAIEMKGAADDGKLHFMTGRECTVDARLDRLFVLAASHGCQTIGIGDGGNEIGFGRFNEAVRKIHPHGASIASTIPTDELVVAAISNWGCYGLEAALAFLLDRPELLHDAEMGVRALEACAAAGAGDGIYTQRVPFEDGQPGHIHASLITLLRQIITNGLTQVEHALTLSREERR